VRLGEKDAPEEKGRAVDEGGGAVLRRDPQLKIWKTERKQPCAQWRHRKGALYVTANSVAFPYFRRGARATREFHAVR